MRTRVTLCVLVAASCWCRQAIAQSSADIINIFGGLVQTAISQAIQAEWKKVSLDQISCIDNILRERGSSLSAVVQQNIGPGDARILDIRAACRRTVVQPLPAPAMPAAIPSREPREPAPIPVREQAIPGAYSVDNLALGEKISRESGAYREYQCRPSEQFSELMRCQKRVPEKTQRGSFLSTYSLLHSSDGTLSYINRFLEPAWFGPNEASEDIARIARKYGAQPNLIAMPQKANPLQGMIATWGTVKLQPVEAGEAAQLALGLNLHLGSLVDFLGNFRRSAHQGLPIYRVVSGAGYVWASNWDQNGRGTLRFFAIDADVLSARARPPTASPAAGSSSEAPSPPPSLPSPTLSGITGPDSPDDRANAPRR
jgi:hypothetical protein